MKRRLKLFFGFTAFFCACASEISLSANESNAALQTAQNSHHSYRALAPVPQSFLNTNFRIANNPVSPIPTPQRWLHHLQYEILPFWTMPTALGEPIGNFPSVRCDDGSLLDPSHPCPEIKDNPRLMKDRQYVVSISRQIYAYGVAFHLTGDIQYLAYAKAGVNYLRKNAFNRKQGGIYSFWDGESKSWQPAIGSLKPQELAYGLLGLSFYYYLTRDSEILPDILQAKAFIFDQDYSSETGSLRLQLQDTKDNSKWEKNIVSYIDHLNAYMLLLSPILPEPYQTEWKQDMQKLSRLMLDRFYSPKENLFFLTTGSPEAQDLQQTDVDFGHTIKAMWMMRMVGLLSGDASLVSFVNENGPKVLERAYLPESGSWASGIKRGGHLDIDKEWWIFAELNQFTASLALEFPSLMSYLSQTANYWFTYFIDPQYGEVWSKVNGLNHQPLQKRPKQWPWKNGYHSSEHALVGYLTASQSYEKPVSLYYAFKQKPPAHTIHPYFYRGVIDKIETVKNEQSLTIYRIDFSDIR